MPLVGGTLPGGPQPLYYWGMPADQRQELSPYLSLGQSRCSNEGELLLMLLCGRDLLVLLSREVCDGVVPLYQGCWGYPPAGLRAPGPVSRRSYLEEKEQDYLYHS